MAVIPNGMNQLSGDSRQNFRTLRDYMAYVVEMVNSAFESASRGRSKDTANLQARYDALEKRVAALEAIKK